MEEGLNLNEIRNNINETDKEIVELLEKRFNLVIKVGQYKIINNLPVLDEKRETIVINKCKEQLKNKRYSNYMEEIYIKIMDTCKKLQENEIKKI